MYISRKLISLKFAFEEISQEFRMTENLGKVIKYTFLFVHAVLRISIWITANLKFGIESKSGSKLVLKSVPSPYKTYAYVYIWIFVFEFCCTS